MENALPLFGDFNLNILDIAAAIIFISCIFTGARKGLVRMIFGLVSGFLSFCAASRLYPQVSIFIKDNTNIYASLKIGIFERLNVEEIIREYIQAGENAVISNLPLPDSVLRLVEESNIPSVYDILNVSTLEDYIISFLANMLLNVICAAAVFILVSLAMRLIITALDIIAKLPVIRKFNKMGGALAGGFTGFIIIWVCVNLFCFFSAGSPDNYQLINSSVTGNFIYAQGLLLKNFTHVFR